MVHLTGMLGFMHAYYVLGLRHADGWIGYGDNPVVRPSCQSANGVASPAIRIKAVVDGLNPTLSPKPFFSICEPTMPTASGWSGLRATTPHSPSGWARVPAWPPAGL